MSETFSTVKRSIESLMGDPITKVLLENSSLTPIQFETFLIHCIGDELVNKHLSGEEKTLLRKKETKVSRGAFNRTLIQARRNITRSLYAVFLLGYAGLFDTPELEPFIETASRIRAHAHDRTANLVLPEEDAAAVSKAIVEELRRAIERLARAIPDRL